MKWIDCLSDITATAVWSYHQLPQLSNTEHMGRLFTLAMEVTFAGRNGTETCLQGSPSLYVLLRF